MKTVSLKLPGELALKLEAAAKKRGTSKSAVMREALEEFFARGNGARVLSFLDLAGDLIGCVEGPADLSTNNKYMEGYGR